MVSPDYSPPLAPRYVYGIQSGDFIKIGVAVNISQRLHTIRLANPHPIKLVLKRRLCAAFHCERKMHEILKDKAIGREWFKATTEEVLAAAEIGTAYAKEVHAKRRARERRAQKWLTGDTERNGNAA
jgi:hypothetical protein